jgi:S-methylmethionine-dependent homocysteine/selenocysteine methylase
MSLYRQSLPQQAGHLFLTDGGLETTLIYQEQVDLPLFAAFPLLGSRSGVDVLRRYFSTYAEVAHRCGVGVVLETPTWRASRDWGAKLGHDAAALAELNRRAVELVSDTRDIWESAHTPVVISGNIGPRGDGYRADARMTIAEAAEYHGDQIRTFAPTSADMVAALTMNYVEEAAGIALAARDAGMPLALSFTLETDGRLPSGDTLAEAIERVDACSDRYPTYYMINCAHPTHFVGMLPELGAAADRVHGLRANASRLSHAELDASTELDAGDPQELAQEYRAIRELLPQLRVVGGCCGTDHRHVEAIGRALQDV